MSLDFTFDIETICGGYFVQAAEIMYKIMSEEVRTTDRPLSETAQSEILPRVRRTEQDGTVIMLREEMKSQTYSFQLSSP